MLSTRAGIGLGKSEHGEIETTAIIEVELIGLVDDRLSICGSSEGETGGRNAADDPGFGRQRHEIGDALLGSNGCNTLGHPDAEIDDGVHLELKSGPTRDDLPR